jgi:hypothetical protein
VRIAVVGGLERHESEIARRAASAGHEVEFHRGRVGGRHAEELESIVERSDLVVIVTEVNSHGAVFIAKKAAHRAGRPSVIVRTCGPSRFQLVIDALQRAPRPGAIAQMVGGC